MNALSGYTEVELNGEILPFKFGTNAWALFCEKRGLEFSDIFKSGVFGKYDNDKYNPSPDIFALTELYYHAYVTACRMKKEAVRYNYEEFSALMDETPGAMVSLQKVLLESRVLGYTFSELAEEGSKGNFQKPA